MTWSIETIKRDWLGESRIAYTADEIVAAFERCEQILGLAWIEAARRDSLGPITTLPIVAMGRYLVALEGVPSCERLLEKLRNREPSAYCELRSIFLLRGDGQTRVELEPSSGLSGRFCDFR